MDLGTFSLSLTVSDLASSFEFYQKLGFEQVMGEADQGWMILRNGTTTIGLFHGMFESNIMTFNPGWDAQAQNLDEFTDVRDLQKAARAAGLEPMGELEDDGEGPGSFMLADPDGNVILLDQHR